MDNLDGIMDMSPNQLRDWAQERMIDIENRAHLLSNTVWKAEDLNEITSRLPTDNLPYLFLKAMARRGYNVEVGNLKDSINAIIGILQLYTRLGPEQAALAYALMYGRVRVEGDHITRIWAYKPKARTGPDNHYAGVYVVPIPDNYRRTSYQVQEISFSNILKLLYPGLRQIL